MKTCQAEKLFFWLGNQPDEEVREGCELRSAGEIFLFFAYERIVRRPAGAPGTLALRRMVTRMKPDTPPPRDHLADSGAAAKSKLVCCERGKEQSIYYVGTWQRRGLGPNESSVLYFSERRVQHPENLANVTYGGPYGS